jgi:hypothetical protein
MSLIEIEAELEKLTADDLRRLALSSWKAYVHKEGGDSNYCNEEDADVLSALDEAVTRADARPGGHSGNEVRGCSMNGPRSNLHEWHKTTWP